MLVQRDKRLIRFIEDFGCATTKQLHKLYFPSRRRAQQRLAQLVDTGKLKRSRDYVSMDYLYYVKKPKEVEHMSRRVDAYIDLKSNYNLVTFMPEYTIENVRADAYFEILRNGLYLPYFLEVQLSSGFRQDKYDTLYNSGAWLDEWEQFPTVIVLSDNHIRYKPSSVKFVQFGNKIKI